jgi:uncharacterized membrane protein YqjE
MSSKSGAGPSPAGEPTRLLDGLRGAADSGLALLSTRLQLLGVELAEERVRVLALLTYGAVALIALGAGLVFLAMFVTVLLWDVNRLLALGVFSVLFIGTGIFALLTALGYARMKSPLFSASLAELRKDREELNSKQ